jgi:hypothetical protein
MGGKADSWTVSFRGPVSEMWVGGSSRTLPFYPWAGEDVNPILKIK